MRTLPIVFLLCAPGITAEYAHLTIVGNLVPVSAPVEYSNRPEKTARRHDPSDLRVEVVTGGERYPCRYVSSLHGEICSVQLSKPASVVTVRLSAFGFKTFIVNVPKLRTRRVIDRRLRHPPPVRRE